jgi:hypothetical protein
MSPSFHDRCLCTKDKDAMHCFFLIGLATQLMKRIGLLSRSVTNPTDSAIWIFKEWHGLDE